MWKRISTYTCVDEKLCMVYKTEKLFRNFMLCTLYFFAIFAIWQAKLAVDPRQAEASELFHLALGQKQVWLGTNFALMMTDIGINIKILIL